MFSTIEIEQMKESAILVNVARGPIMDEDALVAAVENGEIRGAGLDVFETEPPADSPALDCEDIVFSPHHAGGSVASKRNMIEIVGQELRNLLHGDPLENVVNQEVFQYRT